MSFLRRLTYVPETAAEGLKAVARYDFLGFGRFVPYVGISIFFP